MTSIRRKSSRKGFTLVEILIVVIILGILAAIVIPQFTNASTSARQSNMASQDQTIKSQISLFMLQHNDKPPTSALGLWETATGMLLAQSDANDNVPPAAGAQSFGPYLPSAPVNPLTATSAVDYVTAGDVAVDTNTARGASVGTTWGWIYYAPTGEFHGVSSDGYASDDGL
jgi:general secretion pathway protein G